MYNINAQKRYNSFSVTRTVADLEILKQGFKLTKKHHPRFS